MNATTRLIATTTALTLAAALTAACERTPTPQTTRTDDGMTMATTLNAAAAPSLVGTPVEATPATHAIATAPVPTDEPTARDTPANQPAATLTDQKDKTELPLAGQVNNHSSDAFQAGRNEQTDAVPVDAKPDKPAS